MMRNKNKYDCMSTYYITILNINLKREKKTNPFLIMSKNERIINDLELRVCVLD